MLLGRSRQKLRHRPPRHLAHAFEQLHLPWLCPAIYNNAPIRRTSSTPNERTNAPIPMRSSPQPRKRPSLATEPSGRGFASPASAFAVESQEDYVPFDLPKSISQWRPGESLTELPPWDLSAIVNNPADAVVNPDAHRHYSGLRNEVEEIHAVLVAYLQVGQFDAAATTLRRIHNVQDIGSPAVYNAYMAYLATLVSHVVVKKDEALLNTLRRWFNEEVRAKGIKPNGTMVMLLIQASLRASKKQKTSRMIRHFLHLAQKDGVLEEALLEMEICFNNEEFLRVKEAAAAYFAIDGTQKTQANRPPSAGHQSPEIQPHPQKGTGLTALQKALASFSREVRDDVPSEWDEATARQYRIEKDVNKAAMEKWRADHDGMQRRGGKDSAMEHGVLGGLLWNWHDTLTPLIRAELDKKIVNNGRRGTSDRMIIPLLRQMPASKLSAITILAVTRAMVRNTKVPLVKAVTEVGKAIQDETTIEMIKERNREYFSKRTAKDRRKVFGRLLWEERQGIAEAERYQGIVPSGEKEWTMATKVRIGSVLVSMLLKSAKIRVPVEVADARGKKRAYETHPAFSNELEVKKGMRQAYLKMHSYFGFLLRRDPPETLISKHLPMLTPPVPWSAYRRGGYISQPVDVVRTTSQHANTKEYVNLAIEKGDMDQIFAGLDVLGRTSWTINKPVYEVMVNVWNTGEEFGGFPPTHPNLQYPPEPADPSDFRARRTHAVECREIDDRRDGMHSNRCFINLQLEVARAYLHETFYFPHNLDFRGRAYPIPPYLNHMGADHCRGLLQFGQGKELGSNGLWWLRVHLANVFGYDKASFNERHDFAIEHIEDIRDSARRPLEGTRWWAQAEDPWQCLAACIELTNALDLPDPSCFVSHLPIHQDGTCNGLQHYAALGGDTVGAMQVNLEPSDRPADLYTAVANLVQESIAKDAKNGSSLAQVLDGKIKRKVVKQTVMTNVYGVTLSGAKSQILRQLEDFYPDLLKGVLYGKFLAATYIAHKVFEALASMFTGAHNIQYWLAECAARISTSLNPEQVRYIEENLKGGVLPPSEKWKRKKDRNSKAVGTAEARSRSAVVWTTPMRMPVVQPYRKSLAKRVTTNLNILAVNDTSPADPVMKKKQVQAFPPNFIHSLDATHMLLTALKCDELGHSFAAVHDSFWTHAGDVDQMNQVIRDSFIRMHSEDIIGRLAAEFKARYENSMYLMAVPRFSEIGKQIAELPGKRRGQLHGTKGDRAARLLDDLVIERKRIHLLRSEDPAERAEGEKMVTPASIFDEMNGNNGSFIGKLDAALGDVANPLNNERDAFIKQVLSGEGDQETAPEEHDMAEPDEESVEDTEQAGAQTTSSKMHIPELDGELPPEEVEKREAEKKAMKLAMTRWNRKIYIWLPLTFPAVPQRGDYDVKRLESSPYFFS